MTFEIIDMKFSNRYIFMLCDYKSILNLIQTEKAIYNQRHFLYKLVFQNLIFISKYNNDFKFPFYPIIKSNTFHIYNMISLFKRNNLLNKWFLDCNLYAYQSIYKDIKLFYKTHYKDIESPSHQGKLFLWFH